MKVRLGWFVAGIVGGILATIWNTIVFLVGLLIGAGIKAENKSKKEPYTPYGSVPNPIRYPSNWTPEAVQNMALQIHKLEDRVDILEDEIANDSDNDE